MKKSVPGYKNKDGSYIQEPKPAPVAVEVTSAPVPDPELSIDELLRRGLLTIDRVMKITLMNVSGSGPTRNDVANLKDCMSILQDLKKNEKEILDKMTDEELEAASK